MKNIIAFIEKGKPFFEKVSRNIYLGAIRDGFLAAMPVILFSSIFILVAAAHIIDYRILESGSAIRTAVIFFYISNEGISILENSAKIGLPIPKKLKDILYQLNKEDDING